MTRSSFLPFSLFVTVLFPFFAKADLLPQPSLREPHEVHLQDLRQLTFGGENAEAYFSTDGKRLILQATTAKDRCDQIYIISIPTSKSMIPKLEPITQGQGRHTCSYFFPDQSRVLFSS